MIKIRKHTVYCLCMAGGLLFCPACRKEDLANVLHDGKSSEVKVHTRATGEDVTAVLMFWDDVNFHDRLIKNSSEAEMYGSVGMERSIDYYRKDGGETFSTGLLYREGEKDYLHVTGYAPGKALQPKIWNSFVLEVGEQYRDGKTDFLCCDGNVNHRGALADPFTNRELEFRHLMSGIRFVGKRDPVMYGVISVRDVKITLHNVSSGENSIYNKWSVPTDFSLKSFDSEIPEEDQCTYLVSESTVLEKIEISQDNNNFIPADESGITLTSCYVHQNYPDWYTENPFVDLEAEKANGEISSGTINLLLDISANFYWYNGGTPVFYETRTWSEQPVSILSAYGDTMLPGVEYVVNITFKHEGITLQGVQQAWKDGGIHYLPVVPPKQTENE